jgi:cell division protease FtsH
MFEEDPPPQRNNNNRKPPEPQFNWKGLVMLAVSALFIAWAFVSMTGNDKTLMGGAPKIHFSEFQQLLLADKVICTKDKPLYLVKEPATGEEYLEGNYYKELPLSTWPSRRTR